MQTRLRVFVYGTLRPGGRFHARYCAGLVAAEPATIAGAVRTLPAGYPMLRIEERRIAAEGTADPLADAAAAERLAPPERLDEPSTVEGDVLVFDDPAERLPRLDELEGFRPGAPSLYRRVLAPVRRTRDGAVLLAWVYVEPR